MGKRVHIGWTPLIGLAVLWAGTNRGLADGGPTLGGGNLSLQGEPAKFAALQQLGARMCRIPLDARAYWDGQKPTPERADSVVLEAHRHGITPMFLFEYYTRWHGELGGYEKWFAIGQAFAERFRPNSPWLPSQGIRDWGVSY